MALQPQMPQRTNRTATRPPSVRTTPQSQPQSKSVPPPPSPLPAHTAEDLAALPIKDTPLPTAFAQSRDSFVLSMRARNLSGRTIQTRVEGLTLLVRYLLVAHPDVRTPEQLTRAHIEGFLADLLARGQTAATADNRYRALRAYVSWLVEEEEIARDPMRAVHPPTVQVQPPPVLTEDDLAALFAACAGKSFADRRDTAILRLLLDTGLRLEELAGLTLADLDLGQQLVALSPTHAKGRKGRVVAVGPKTALALDRYVRARARHVSADAEEAGRVPTEQRPLWLGLRGPMRGNGIYQMLRKRARQAGVADVFTHRFRHTATHRQLAAGAQESHVMATMGWESAAMLKRYGAAERARRAQDEFRRLRVNEDL